MSVSFSRGLILGLLVVLVSGCGTKAPPAGAPTANSGSTEVASDSPRELSAAVTTTLDQKQDITSGEYFDFCRALEADALRGDTASLNARLDMDQFLDTAVEGLEVSAKVKQDLYGGVKEGLQKGGFGSQVVSQMQQRGMWKMLRLHKQKGRHMAWFRMKGLSGVNYHHLILAKNSQGEIRINDIYIMATGELMSATLRRGLLPMITSSNRSALAKLVASESDYIKHINKINEFQQSISRGQFQQAMQVYDSLPTSVQQSKTLLILRLTAAIQVDDMESYKKASETLRALYPNEPNADLLAIDSNTVLGDYEGALASIDRVDAAIGGDPYLDELRASLQLQNRNFDEAKRLALQATKLDPPSSDAYWVLVNITLQEQDHAGTLELLKTMNKTFELEFADLTTLPEYANFVKSPEYQEWLKVPMR